MVQGIKDYRMPVTENKRSPGADVIDVFVPVDIEDVRSLAACDEGRSTAYTAISSYGRVHAAWDRKPGAFEELLRSCVFHLVEISGSLRGGGHHYNKNVIDD
jgi:hypothetical protein